MLDLLIQVVGILGVEAKVATKIVNAVDAAGWAFVGASLILSIAGAGALSFVSVSANVIIFQIKEFMKRNLKAQAIAY